jgi:MFS family permease
MSPPTAIDPGPTWAAKWTIIGTVLLGAFLFSVNAKGTVVEANVIVQAVGLDRYKVQWVNGPAGVAGLTFLFSSIYLTQRFGARRVFLLGAVCLAAGSFGAALMRNGWQDAMAALLRSGAGFFTIPGLVLLQRLLPHRQRVTYCTYLALIYGGEVIAEPLGALLAFNPSWRALFLGLGAGGVLLSVAALVLFPDDRPARPPDQAFDFAGAALFAAVLGLLFFLLYRGNYLGWQVSTPVCVAAGALAVAGALFLWREGAARAPFISLLPFAHRTIALTLLCAACWAGALYGVAVQLPHALLLIGYEHVKTGWVMLPMSLVVLATMLLGEWLTRRSNHVWALRLGLAGMAVAGFGLARLDLDSSWQWVMGVSAVWGVFAGMCLPPIAVLTFEGQQPQEAATTGAMKFLMRALGGTVGILVAGIVIDRGAAWGLDFVRDSITHGQGALQVAQIGIRDHMARQGSAPPAAAEQADAVLGYWVNLHAGVIGYRIGLRFCAYLAAAGLAVACFISRRKEVSIYDTNL